MLTTLLLAAQEKPAAFPVLQGPYLGQTPPGMAPELFAPGIVSTELNTRDIAIAPDGKEIYFCVNLASFTFSTILVTRQKDGVWTEPEVMEHMENPEYWNIEPCISADGKKFFFMSNRPDKARNEVKGDEDIWVMDRTGDAWGEPYNLGLPVNSDSAEFFPSLTRDGTLYFARRDKASGEEAIFRSRLRDGKYQEPEKLPPQVNSGQTRFNAFVAPDESYIIVPTYGRKDSLGATDYYVSFRNPDDSWTEAVNMGERINTAGGGEYSPSISPDGKYLFFMSSRVIPKAEWPEKLTAAFLHDLHAKLGNGNSSIYWVDARVIESLRPKKSQ
jgi:dipeptidyl aminopeptidase/acylaminoacyl peptidase